MSQLDVTSSHDVTPYRAPDISAAVRLRAAREEDRSFVFSSWLNSYRKSDAAKGLDGQTYYTQQRATIERLLSRSSGVIACQPSDEKEILGWLVLEPASSLVVHYAYVKHLLRREGLASHMLRSVLDSMGTQPLVYYTHHTGNRCRKLMERFDASFQPHLSR